MNQKRQLTLWNPLGELLPHSIDSLFRTTMSDPNGSRKNQLKRNFDELPDHLTIADGPPNKRHSSSRLEFIMPRHWIASWQNVGRLLQGHLRLRGRGRLWCVFTLHAYILWLTSFAPGAQACIGGSTRCRYQGFHTLCCTKCVSFHHGVDGLRYRSDFLSRLKFMNMPAETKRIHFLFPKDPIQVPYLQVVRMFWRS